MKRRQEKQQQQEEEKNKTTSENNDDDDFDLVDWSPVVKAVKTPTKKPINKNLTDWSPVVKAVKSPSGEEQMDSETSRLIFEPTLEHEHLSFLVSPKKEDRKRPSTADSSESNESRLQRALSEPVFRRLEEFLADARFADPPISRDLYVVVFHLSQLMLPYIPNNTFINTTDTHL